MLSIKGRFEKGIIRPLEPVEDARDGQEVIITFVDESGAIPTNGDAAWDALTNLLQKSSVDTGVSDLAHQHDHYLYGKPKQD